MTPYLPLQVSQDAEEKSKRRAGKKREGGGEDGGAAEEDEGEMIAAARGSVKSSRSQLRDKAYGGVATQVCLRPVEWGW